jgi:hypothetical protein
MWGELQKIATRRASMSRGLRAPGNRFQIRNRGVNRGFKRGFRNAFLWDDLEASTAAR